MKKRVRRIYYVNHLLSPDRRIDDAAVLCQDERILAVGNRSSFAKESQLEVFEYDNGYLVPGFIDTHIHGAGGFDCSSVKSSINSFDDMSVVLAKHGVTSFMPTVVADISDKMLENLENLAQMIDNNLSGASAVGINIEGPFINPGKSGAQKQEALCPVDLGFAKELINAGKGKVRIMTFAPELDNSSALIQLLRENNVIPSMGHSVADEKTAIAAVDAGANHCTHLFNGMKPMHQRDIGLCGVALTDNRVTVELIIDGRHIHPRVVDLACRCKPNNQLIGISDCNMAFGMVDGKYQIGPSEIEVHGGVSKNKYNALAGTTTTLASGWHGLISSGHLSETKAAMTVTSNPAIAFDLQDRGKLLPNCRADLAIFDCDTNVPLLTVCNGRIVYQA